MQNAPSLRQDEAVQEYTPMNMAEGNSLSGPIQAQCCNRRRLLSGDLIFAQIGRFEFVAEQPFSSLNFRPDIFFRYCSSGTDPRRTGPEQESCCEMLRFSNRPISTIFTPPLARLPCPEVYVRK
jgi:hypothetical protein